MSKANVYQVLFSCWSIIGQVGSQLSCINVLFLFLCLTQDWEKNTTQVLIQIKLAPVPLEKGNPMMKGTYMRAGVKNKSKQLRYDIV